MGEGLAAAMDPASSDLSLERLTRLNRSAWDRLYRSTGEPVWGHRPLPFVTDPAEGVAAWTVPGARVLDAGTGEGRHLPFLLELSPRVAATDASLAALRKIPTEIRARVRLAHGDLAALPFPDVSFDVVLACDVVETLPDVSTALGEFFRVLRPGGALLCNIPGPDDPVARADMTPLDSGTYLFHDTYFYRFLEPKEARLLLGDARFEIISEKCWSWREDAHPNFRDTPHVHTSMIYRARRAVQGTAP